MNDADDLEAMGRWLDGDPAAPVDCASRAARDPAFLPAARFQQRMHLLLRAHLAGPDARTVAARARLLATSASTRHRQAVAIDRRARARPLRWWGWAAAAALLLAATAALAWHPLTAIATTADGDLLGADGAPVDPGSRLHPGDLITAVSVSTLRFRDGTALALQPGARLRLVAGQKAWGGEAKRVELQAGGLSVEVEPQPAGQPFVATTPHATLTVLGTAFLLEVQPSATSLLVTDGRVQVVSGEARREVAAGSSIRCDSGGLSGPDAGRTWHVAPHGDDAAAGDAGRPFRSLARAAAVAQAGDVCLIRSGTYRETLRPLHAGTAQAPITFRAAGDGPVVISGADPVTGWEGQGGGIMAAPIAASAASRAQVLWDGVPMPAAAFPAPSEDRFAPAVTPATCTVGSTRILVPALDQAPGAWVGARLWGLIGAHWTSQTAVVTASGPGWLEVGGRSQVWFPDAMAVNGGAGGIRLGGVPAAEGAPGTWSIRDGWLRVVPPAGQSIADHRVELQRRQLGVDLSGCDGITVAGLELQACTALMGGNGCRIVGGSVSWLADDAWLAEGEPVDYTDQGGIRIDGHANRLDGVRIRGSPGNGVTMHGDHNLVVGCDIADTGWHGRYGAGVWIAGRGNSLECSRVRRAGRAVCAVVGQEARIVRNDLSEACLLASSAGVVHGSGLDGQGSVIAGNLIHGNRDDAGAGIWFGNGLSGLDIHHNVCWDLQHGIHLGPGGVIGRVRIWNNTLWNCRGMAIDRPGAALPGDVWIANTLADRAGYPGAGSLGNLVIADARFVAPQQGDFRLRPGSSARGAGVAVPGAQYPDAGACGGQDTEAACGPPPAVAAPELSLVNGADGQSRLVVAAGSGIRVLLSLDGRIPEADAPAYTAPIRIAPETLVTARGIGSGPVSSQVVSLRVP